MNQLQVHAFSLPKPPPHSLLRSPSAYELSRSDQRRRRFAPIAAASTSLLHLPLLPFPKEQVFLRFRIGNPISCVFNSRRHRTMNMDAGLKRPMCPRCSKPTQVCLCTRFKTLPVENHVAVTILQHTLEKKHPLNSARIASLGIRNVRVVSVSDVNSLARFAVRPLGLDDGMDSSCLDEESRDCGAFGISKRKRESLGGLISCSGSVESSDFSGFSECLGEKKKIFVSLDEVLSEGTESYCATFGEGPVMNPIEALSGPSEDEVVGFTVAKYGAISSVTINGIPKDQSELAANGSGKGFNVSKFQRKQLDGNADNEELQEFEMRVPPGSVLLYPSEDSVGIEAIDIKVTNVIVLDATWAKARRMYSENPWLKQLPHLRLDMADVSLYREVRQQPKAGCLSTIESIVYALKALGEDSDKLDGLLEVFKSMVGDQRRCKDERLSQVLVPSEYKKLHLYEARYLALLEESLYKNKSLFVHFVLDPISVNETFTEASFAARYACLVSIEKVERLDIGALVFIRGIGRVKIVQFAQEEPFLSGSVMPIKDPVLLDAAELNSKVLELKEALRNLNSLEIKLKASEEDLLQTQTSNALKWAEKTLAIDCEEAFIPSSAERISFAALQSVSGSMESERSNLQKEKLRAMDVNDTLERLRNSVEYVNNNISTVAAKLALQSLRIK